MTTVLSTEQLSDLLNKMDLAATASMSTNQNVSIAFNSGNFCEVFFTTNDLIAHIIESTSNTTGDTTYISLPLSVLKSIQKICNHEKADSVLLEVTESKLTYSPMVNGTIVQNKTVVALYWPFTIDEYETDKAKLKTDTMPLSLKYDTVLSKYAAAFGQVISMMPLQDDNLGFFVKGNKVYFTDNRHMYYDAVLPQSYVDNGHIFIPARLFKLLNGMLKQYGSASFQCSDDAWSIEEDNIKVLANYKVVELLYPTDEEKAENGPDQNSKDICFFSMPAAVLSDITSNFEAHDRLYSLGEVLKPISVSIKDDSAEFSWSSDNESVDIVKPVEKSGVDTNFCFSSVLIDAVLATLPAEEQITIASQNGDLSSDHCGTFELKTKDIDAIIVKLVK